MSSWNSWKRNSKQLFENYFLIHHLSGRMDPLVAMFPSHNVKIYQKWQSFNTSHDHSILCRAHVTELSKPFSLNRELPSEKYAIFVAIVIYKKNISLYYCEIDTV